jgi:hypothetical protein
VASFFPSHLLPLLFFFSFSPSNSRNALIAQIPASFSNLAAAVAFQIPQFVFCTHAHAPGLYSLWHGVSYFTSLSNSFFFYLMSP